MPASSRASVGMLLALSLVWGSTWIANDMLREQGGPLRLAMLRYLLAGFLIACVLCTRQMYRRLLRGAYAGPTHTHSSVGSSSEPQIARFDEQRIWPKSWVAVNLLLGCTMFVAPDLLLVWSAGHLAAGWMPMIYAGLPLGLLLMAGELQIPAILGVGAMLVLLNGSLPVSGSRLLWILPVAGAVLLQGWSLVCAQRQFAAVTSLRGVMVQLVTAASLLWTATRIWPETPEARSLMRWPASSLGALVLLAGLATAIAYPLYYRLLQNLAPAQLAVSEWLQTLVAIGESAILFHLKPAWSIVGAAAVLIGCAMLLLKGDREQANGIFS